MRKRTILGADRAVWSGTVAAASLGLMVLVPFTVSGSAAVPPARGVTAPAIDFQRQVRPILARHCFSCHGADEKSRTANLRLDVREDAVGPRARRPAALVPGKPESSLALQRILASAEGARMPPPSHGPRVPPEEVAILRAWVRQGAPYAQHWAWTPPRRPNVPAVKNVRWARNPVDRFVLARLERAGIQPALEAERYTLLRRVSFDLRGLPPTPEEVTAFERDTAPGAYERVVDRFLADPAYGERWARMWLDLARYADSAGYGSDPLRPHIWRYRDWLIDAFNRDLPYDQFTAEQLAGDMLPNATLEQRVATAFHRNTMTNTEGGTDDEEFRTAAVKDRVDTTMQVWMGLTMGCAKCHTHKYDPISHRDYYRFYAIFNQTADNDAGDESPTVPAPTPAIAAQNQKINEQVANLKRQLQAAESGAAPNADAKALKDEIAKLEKARPAPPPVPVMAELPETKRRQTHILIKSNFLETGEQVDAGVPQAFHPLPTGAAANRLTVARWLVDPRNPLTSRVAVNRFWAQLFGTGLVETEEDFGTQGELPSHPELLDYLATSFGSGLGLPTQVQPGAGNKEQGTSPWSMKALLRLLVTSATYRQSATPRTAKAHAADPTNRLLSRGPRLRLEAEMVRDQALQLSGLLARKLGGPSVYPPQPDGLWQAAFNGQRTWATSAGEDRYRRGLYTFWRRTVPYPSMATFDAPSREFCVVRRSRTNTPLQALVTLNDPVYVEAAQALARRVMKEGGATAEERARRMLQLALCRPPRVGQVSQVASLYRSELAHFQGEPAAAKALATEPLGPLPAGTDTAEAAAWTVVANTLLNLDGVMTR